MSGTSRVLGAELQAAAQHALDTQRILTLAVAKLATDPIGDTEAVLKNAFAARDEAIAALGRVVLRCTEQGFELSLIPTSEANVAEEDEGLGLHDRRVQVATATRDMTSTSRVPSSAGPAVIRRGPRRTMQTPSDRTLPLSGGAFVNGRTSPGWPNRAETVDPSDIRNAILIFPPPTVIGNIMQYDQHLRGLCRGVQVDDWKKLPRESRNQSVTSGVTRWRRGSRS